MKYSKYMFIIKIKMDKLVDFSYALSIKKQKYCKQEFLQAKQLAVSLPKLEKIITFIK